VYSLQVEKTSVLPTVTFVAARARDYLLNQAHQLTAGDPRDRFRTGSHHREYRVELKAGVSYTIDMVSSDFDSYLRLENSAREVLASDDDGGGNLNARLVFTPRTSGTYHVIATSYRPASGRYRLTVSTSGP
jgi:hypothetical protein